MTEAAPALTRVFEALCRYNSTPRPVRQAVVSDFPVHFYPRAFPCFDLMVIFFETHLQR